MEAGRLHRFPDGPAGAFDHLVGMGRGDEHGLELGGRHIDAPLQHSGEISGKGLRIGAKRRTVVGNRLLRKEAGKKGAHAVDGKALFPEGLFQPSGLPVDLLIDLRMDDELSEGFQTGGAELRGEGRRRPQGACRLR